MKRIIITLSVLFFSFLVTAQENTIDNDYTFFKDGNSYWTVDATYGVIAGWDAETFTDDSKY
ncbi:hypothetical protein MC378_03750 [Polaribacter sp. MSW13]|uniref:Uncharacterized protein n=1 Tax=Polaribacter marinus TaxID=2916838 RepID=A0A9X2ALW3_9FLAO|nr:hypothetical protein [Polaribacter marinus]MCI2228269.1 hypothetical protein [Polaribacter marinus]